MNKTLTGFIAALLLAAPAYAQQFVRLQPKVVTGTIPATGGSVTITQTDVSGIGGIGTLKVQTLDSYSGTWEVQCSLDGTTFDADNELKLTAADSTTVVYEVSDEIGIWDVTNASACRAVRVISTAGFAASNVGIVMSAIQSGGGGGGGGGGAAGEVTISDGTDTALVSAGGELLVSCADCSGSGVSHVDDAAFTVAVDDIVPVAGIYRSTLDSVTDGDAGALAMLQNRILMTHLVDASGVTATVGGGTQYAEDAAHASGNTGTLALVVRNDAGTALAADGDNIPLMVNSAGALYVAGAGTFLVGDGAGALNVVVDSSASVAVTNAGTFVVQENGDALTALQLIDNLVLAEDAVHSTGAPGMLPLVVRQDAHSDLAADGDYIPMTVDADGGLRVSIVAGAGTGGTALADDADFTAGTTSGTPIVGFYQSAVTACTDGDACVVGITAQRTAKVTLFASNGSELTASSDMTVGTAFGTTGPGGVAQYSNFDGAALPTATNVDTELEAVPIAASIVGVQYMMLVSEDGSLQYGTATTPMVVGDGAGALNIICDSGCGSGTVYDHGEAITLATANGVIGGGRVSAAAPSTVGVIDDDFVANWMLNTGAAVTQPSFAGVLATVGSGANGTGVQRMTIATDDEINDDLDAIASSTGVLDNAIYVDDADWTDNTSSHALVGGIYQTTPHTVTDGDVSPFQVNVNGYLQTDNSPITTGVAETSVNDAATSTAVITPADPLRKTGVCRNASTAIAYIATGIDATTASPEEVLPGGLWYMPLRFTGVVNAIWAADASGSMKCATTR